MTERDVDLVLFDLGGVLIEPGGVGPLRELAGIESDEELWTRWLGCTWVQSFESGACTPEEFAAGFVSEWMLDLSPDDFLAEFATWPQGPFPGADALVERVRAEVPGGLSLQHEPLPVGGALRGPASHRRVRLPLLVLRARAR